MQPTVRASGLWSSTGTPERLRMVSFPAVPSPGDYPHQLALPTRWHDNDVYGHVNNVDYYAFFDTVINAWLIREGGLDIHAGDAIGLCAESHCAFKGPLAFPETVTAGLRRGQARQLERALRDRPVRRGRLARRRRLVRACVRGSADAQVRADPRAGPGGAGTPGDRRPREDFAARPRRPGRGDRRRLRARAPGAALADPRRGPLLPLRVPDDLAGAAGRGRRRDPGLRAARVVRAPAAGAHAGAVGVRRSRSCWP